MLDTIRFIFNPNDVAKIMWLTVWLVVTLTHFVLFMQNEYWWQHSKSKSEHFIILVIFLATAEIISNVTLFIMQIIAITVHFLLKALQDR
jgi:hypothetical protein